MGLKIILVANTDWYLYNFRASLIRELRSKGVEVVLVSPPGAYSDAIKSWGFRWIPWQVGRKSISPRAEIKAMISLAQIYRRERPDLVHHHTIKPVFYGTLAARLTRVSGIVNAVTGRGYVFLGEDRRARFLRLMIQPGYRLLMQNPKISMIFENQIDREYFMSQNLVGAVQTHLIESVGVDPERFRPQPEPDGQIVILLAARMLWDKGVGIFAEAARILQKRQVAARFVLAGPLDSGNPAAIPERVIHAWQAEGLLEWWGWQENMEQIYAQSHIVTLPSFHEGVPTVLLEAAACARALVASDISGCRALIEPERSGLLVPPRDAEALAEALIRLVDSPQLRQNLGKAARLRVLQKFTHQQVNASTLLVYGRMLQNYKGDLPF